jgi:hypothetical protein
MVHFAEREFWMEMSNEKDATTLAQAFDETRIVVQGFPRNE